MTPTQVDRQEAGSLKFEPRGSIVLRQLASGLYALYPLGGISTPFWIGPAADIVDAYLARPEPVPRTRPAPPPRQVAGINIDDLEIDL